MSAKYLFRLIKQLMKMVIFPVPILRYLRKSVGAEYGLGVFKKSKLLFSVMRNSSREGSGSTFYEQLTIVHAVLEIPRSLEGVVAEFGCYKGAATASLSLACALTGRRLVVFDSFEGLPHDDEITSLGTGEVLNYKAGDLMGSIDEVKSNVLRWGKIESCEFVKGFFDHTLPQRIPERYVLVFEDADLPSSVRTVIKWVWPLLQDGCIYFCHEARDYEVVSIFFDAKWWKEEVCFPAPGFVGSGLGIPIDPRGSMLGYALKKTRKATYER